MSCNLLLSLSLKFNYLYKIEIQVIATLIGTNQSVYVVLLWGNLEYLKKTHLSEPVKKSISHANVGDWPHSWEAQALTLWASQNNNE